MILPSSALMTDRKTFDTCAEMIAVRVAFSSILRLGWYTAVVQK